MHPKMLREVEEEATSLLSNLIRINTTNPPGNEIEAAKYLTKNLKEDDFVCELLESAPGRGSIVTRLKGSGGKPSLLLLSHLDVVAADPREWSVDPFGGVVRNGFVWGRGALDMKGMTTIEIMTMKLLKRNDVKLKGDVVLAATADEERGGHAGAGWLTANCLEKIRADFVLNEGGGMAIPTDGKNIYGVQTAEKGILWLRIRTKGRPGHGSVPGGADNAIMRMNKVIERLGSYHSEIVLIPTVRQFLTQIAKTDKRLQKDLTSLLEKPELADRVLDAVARQNEYLAEEIRARMRMTITPTMIRAGVKENIIPSECEAVFDCRVLPGQSPDQAMREIKELLKDVGLEKLEFETIEANDPSESASDTSLYWLIEDVLKEFEPSCVVAPVLMTGGTDSRFFRKVGSVCYGFHPLRADIPYAEMQKTIHGIDERISVENLVFGTSVLYDLVKRFLT